MKKDRRRLLKLLPAGVAAATLGPGPSVQAQSNESASKQVDGSFDVAIVGAGVAGCYVAYRLTQATVDDFKADSPLRSIIQKNGYLKVALFEYSGRVGGRLLAAELPEIGSGARRYAEFGGFRFQPQMHIVRDLANHLGLENEPFPVDEPLENFIFLRGQRYRRGDLVSGVLADKLYRFSTEEAKLLQAGGDFSTYVANQAFAQLLNRQVSRRLQRQWGLRNDPTIEVYGAVAGYITLRQAYHKAFRRQDWAAVKQLRELYESSKLAVVVDQRALVDWSWWALLTRFLTSEAIAYYEDSGGYNDLWAPGSVSSTLREDFYFANPADTFPDIYGPGKTPTPQQTCEQTAWRHITTGYSDIPNQLFKAFIKAEGASVFLNHQLLTFTKTGSSGYTLDFFQRQSGTLDPAQASAAGQKQPASQSSYQAQFVILAMPKRALRQLDRSTPFLLDPTVNQLLDSVLDDPAIRFFIAYKEPWWLKAKDHSGAKYPGTDQPYPAPTCGRSTTDLRLRQFYYWHTAAQGASNQHSFVLASYSNGQAEIYWRRLQDGVAYDSLKGTVRDPQRADGARGRGPRVASREMAMLAHQQLMQVTGVDNAPEPYYAHFQNWTKDPWGAGWHAFTAGHSDNSLVPQILQPLPTEQVYICGECYSNVQGWVQGALNTSEVMLENRLGLKYPSEWLTPGGTWLGPGSEGIPTV